MSSMGNERKKLLILAANAESIPIVKTAQEMGIYTIVTDYIAGSPAKEIADQYFDIDGKDIETLEKLVEQEAVDGILVGCADPLVPSYVSLCKRTLRPCYIPEYALGFFTDKTVFKRICRETGIPVIKSFFEGTCYEKVPVDDLVFPVIVKPAVGRGGRGVSLCREISELKEAFVKAKRYADNEEVIVEEYFEGDDVTVNYLFYNGEPHLIALMDRHVLKEAGSISAVTYGGSYPSEYTDAFMAHWYEKFYRLLKKVGIQNGLLNIQMFVKNGIFYPYDPDGVLNAELSGPIYPTVYQTDIIRHLIEFALTGDMQIREPLKEDGSIPGNKAAASIWILLKPGKVKTLKGRKSLDDNPYVLSYVWRLEESAEVTDEMARTEKATLARIWIAAENKRQLQEQIKGIRAAIHAFDKYGNDLVCREMEGSKEKWNIRRTGIK